MDIVLKILLGVVVAVTVMWAGVLLLFIFLVLVRWWKNRRPATSRRPERLAEITSWLQKRIAPEEAIAALEAFNASVIEPTVRQEIVEGLFLLFTGLWIAGVFWRIVDGPRRTSVDCFRAWIADHDLSADELWKYDTGGDSWENLHGDCGYAIVRRGVVLDFWMDMMN
jgi:membrane protein required for beta-lactamase induction